jgi:antitoxin component of MazEF toxin-antitoxin module
MNEEMEIQIQKELISYNLTDMLDNLTEDNIHQYIETGQPIGKEI